MPDHHEVKCYLCGSLFNIEGPPDVPGDQCDDIVTLYYCEPCSELKIDVKCRNCGKIFQELPIKGKEEEEEIGSLCEECSNRMIMDIMFDPRKISIQRQKEVLSNPDLGKTRWKEALGIIGHLAREGNPAAIDYACELLQSSSWEPRFKSPLVQSMMSIKDQRVKEILLDILRTIKSDNKTRTFIKDILEAIASTKDKNLMKPLQEISERFSVKMKSHIHKAIKTLR